MSGLAGVRRSTGVRRAIKAARPAGAFASASRRHWLDEDDRRPASTDATRHRPASSSPSPPRPAPREIAQATRKGHPSARSALVGRGASSRRTSEMSRSGRWNRNSRQPGSGSARILPSILYDRLSYARHFEYGRWKCGTRDRLEPDLRGCG